MTTSTENIQSKALLATLTAHLDSETARRDHPPGGGGPVITLSREAGAGGEAVAQEAVALLSRRSGRPWLVLDDALAERIVEDHHLPRRIREFLTEEQTSSISDLVEELIGLHPNRNDLVRKMVETIVHLAAVGHVLFVGRAAHVVLHGYPEAFHVRIIGDLDARAERITALTGLPLDEARRKAKAVDRARSRFIARHFHRNLRDPHGYDLVINTDRLSASEAGRLVAALAYPAPVEIPVAAGAR